MPATHHERSTLSDTDRPSSPAKTNRTRKQQEAARRNGAKSRGPRTAEGRAASSRNALKHGLFAERAADWLESAEDREQYQRAVARYHAEYGAVTEVESNVIALLASDWIRLRRAQELEDVVLGGGDPGAPNAPLRTAQAKKLPSIENCQRQQVMIARRIKWSIQLLDRHKRERAQRWLDALSQADAVPPSSADFGFQEFRNEPGAAEQNLAQSPGEPVAPAEVGPDGATAASLRPTRTDRDDRDSE